jgi:hypothetical protein
MRMRPGVILSTVICVPRLWVQRQRRSTVFEIMVDGEASVWLFQA